MGREVFYLVSRLLLLLNLENPDEKTTAPTRSVKIGICISLYFTKLDYDTHLKLFSENSSNLLETSLSDSKRSP